MCVCVCEIFFGLSIHWYWFLADRNCFLFFVNWNTVNRQINRFLFKFTGDIPNTNSQSCIATKLQSKMDIEFLLLYSVSMVKLRFSPNRIVGFTFYGDVSKFKSANRSLQSLSAAITLLQTRMQKHEIDAFFQRIWYSLPVQRIRTQNWSCD